MVSEASELKEKLNDLISRECGTLRKWWRNTPELLDAIPEELRNKSDLERLACHQLSKERLWDFAGTPLMIHRQFPLPNCSMTYPPPRGLCAQPSPEHLISWAGMLQVCCLPSTFFRSCGFCDSLGMTLSLPEPLQQKWKTWAAELPLLGHHSIPHRLGCSNERTCHKSKAYGGAVYLKVLMTDTTVQVYLVIAKRVVSWILRFLWTRRLLSKDTPHYLTVLELRTAKTILLVSSQNHTYPVKLSHLQKNKALPASHPLASLAIYLNSQELMQVGGKLQKAELEHDVAHPVILSIKSHFT